MPAPLLRFDGVRGRHAASVAILAERLRTPVAAASLRAAARRCSRSPVSIAIALATTALTVLFRGPEHSRRVISELAAYRGSDLVRGQWWRLPLSALLAQSWAQLAWTLLMALTLFPAVETAIGRLRTALTLAVSHLLPTLAVAGWATWTADRHLLAVRDYGTSCLVMAAVATITALHRSRVLTGVILAVLCGDVFLNSLPTIIEHLISVLLAAALTLACSDKSKRTTQEAGSNRRASPLLDRR